MENIVLNPLHEEYTNFISLPMGVYKNIQFYNNIQGRAFTESSLCKKDGCTYYSHVTFKVKKSKNGYYRQNTIKNGFTLNEKNKLQVWFGKNIFELPGINDIFKHMNLNWLHTKLIGYVTKGIAEKMLTGKITNNIDLVKAYIKVMRLNCSPKLLCNVIETCDYSKPLLLSLLGVSKDQNHLLEKCMSTYANPNSEDEKPSSYFTMDFVKQAQILGRQIDFMWSVKRMREEHQKWTKEIMDVEVNDMQDVVVETLLPYLEFKRLGFTLLTTKKEIYAEGKSMNHCVYTNYWNNVQHGGYLVYQVEYRGERATLGLYITDTIMFNQCYGYANRPVSEECKLYVDDFVRSLNSWALTNKLTKELNFI